VGGGVGGGGWWGQNDDNQFIIIAKKFFDEALITVFRAVFYGLFSHFLFIKIERLMYKNKIALSRKKRKGVTFYFDVLVLFN